MLASLSHIKARERGKRGKVMWSRKGVPLGPVKPMRSGPVLPQLSNGHIQESIAELHKRWSKSRQPFPAFSSSLRIEEPSSMVCPDWQKKALGLIASSL
jgi:hypothetical protein